MGLIDLKTNLKSLQFSGDFKLPSTIVNTFYRNSVKSVYEPLPYLGKGYDGFIRGGLVDRYIYLADDVIRFGNFITNTPRGLFFEPKELGLQRMNPKLEYGGDKYRRYSILNSAAQIGVGDTSHFYRHGTVPTLNDNSSKYFEYIKQTQLIPKDASNNRLVKLYRNLIVESPNATVIDRYDGGGNSNYGIGETIIYRYANSNEAATNGVWSRKRIDEISNQYSIGKIREDFRKYIFPSTDGKYEKYNLKSRIGLGNSDDLNKVRIFYGKQNFEDSRYNKEVIDNQLKQYNVNDKKKEIRDMVKFRIEIVDNDNPTHGYYIILRANFSNLNDSINQTLNSVTYNGRADPFYIYQNTSRRISFNCKLVAESKSEMKPLYQKLNALMASMYPDYKEFKMRGTLVRLTIGDYLSNQYGFITDLNITYDNDMPWEIALSEPEGGEDSDMYQLPKMAELYFNFTPIHNFLPQNSLWRSKFILPLNDTSESSNKKWLTEMKLLEENVKLQAPTNISVIEQSKAKDFTEFSLNSAQNTSNYLNFLNGSQ